MSLKEIVLRLRNGGKKNTQDLPVGEFRPCDDCPLFEKGGCIERDKQIPEGFKIVDDGKCSYPQNCGCWQVGLSTKNVICVVPKGTDIPPKIKV